MTNLLQFRCARPLSKGVRCIQVHFTVVWEEKFGTEAGVRLIQGVRLIWGPINTGFTVK